MGILFYSKEGRLIDANPSALKIIGASSLKDCANLIYLINLMLLQKRTNYLKKD